MFRMHLSVDITNRLNKFYAAISSVLKDKYFGFNRKSLRACSLVQMSTYTLLWSRFNGY